MEPTPVPTPVALATRVVPFTVHAPENTPPGETIYVLVQPMVDWDWLQHVPLTKAVDNVWTGEVSLPEGTLVRYVYDRWDEIVWGQPFKETREAHGETVKIESRYLLMAPDLTRVEDTIETWNDHRSAATTGTITGTVTNTATGEPLVDTNVSVGGIHTATDYLGRFTVANVAAGPQRVTVHRTLGDHHATWANVDISEGQTATVELGMEPATPVSVTFDVTLPEDTRPEVEIRIVGNTYNLGGRFGAQPNSSIIPDINVPVLERVSAERAVGTVDLYDGMNVEYQYSLGIGFWNSEKSQSGAEVYRSIFVDASEPVQRDYVATWRPPHAVGVTVNVEVPPDTTPGAPVTMMGVWMAQTGPLKWTAQLYGFPGSGVQYEYVLGADHLGGDGTTGAEAGRRFVIPESDTVVNDVVERWEFGREAVALSAGETTDVTFRVTVPPSTSPGAAIRLVGDVPQLSAGVTMAPLPGNPWMYETTIRLPAGEIGYTYDRGTAGTESADSRTASVVVASQTVDDWVTSWADDSPDAQLERPEYITGVYTPDLWSPSYLPLSEQTFGRIKEHNGGWTVVSSVWSYGETEPRPTLEPRSIISGTVRTPRQDAVTQARIAHEQGLKVLLAPQFNMEMSPGGVGGVCAFQTNEWWEAWIDLADQFWMWNALLAEEIGAEALLLPGNCFHVFPGTDGFETVEFADVFDSRLTALVEKVRGVYRGRLIASGSQTGYEFLKLVDFLGTTTYDTGHPDVPYDAPVDEWRAAYDALFAETVDPLYDHWDKPIVFYTIHLPAHPDNPDPTGEEFQAKRLEAIFQALLDRPWIAGSFSWSYSMIDAPLNGEDGVRGRLAEAVLAKYYGAFAGR